MTGGLGNRYCMPIAKRCRGYRRIFSCQAFVESIKQLGLANKILDRPASRSNHAGRSTSGKATAAFGQPLDFPTWADHAVVVTTPTLRGVRTPRALSAAATGRGQNAPRRGGGNAVARIAPRRPIPLGEPGGNPDRVSRIEPNPRASRQIIGWVEKVQAYGGSLPRTGSRTFLEEAFPPHARSKRSKFITLLHAAAKSFTNFSFESTHP
jgi:hypothetical protein